MFPITGANTVELFQLQSFLRVAQEGSITRAAETLCLTQPAVTQQVRALERELGVALFDRTGRGVRLTPAGAALQQYARRSLALLDECRQAIADLEAGASGRLVLGAGVTTSIFHLPGWLRAFQERHPGIDVVVRTGRSRETAALVLEREIDLGLVTSGVQNPDLRVVELYEEEIILVAPRGHPLAGRALPAAELARAPLILFRQGAGFREYLDRALQRAGITPQVKMESDSAEAIKSFVAVGLGVSFLPAAAVEAEVRAGVLACVEVAGLPPLKRRTCALYRGDRYLNAGARAFLELLLARYRPDAGGGDPPALDPP
jgi:DNA-binding transcriptional LysR family regulator